MIHIHLSDALAETNAVTEELMLRLTQAAQQVLAVASAQTPAEATLVVTNDSQLAQLNQDYLGVNEPTDVLAFPNGEVDPETDTLYLGDVIISYPRAAAQAQEAGHPVIAELQLLTVHGMLHLCGFDHADEVGKAKMWELQGRVLRDLGVPIITPSDLQK